MKEGPAFKPYLGRKGTYRGGAAKSDSWKLSSNENPWGPSPLVRESLPWILDNLHRYPPMQANGLREELAEFHQSQLQASQFVVGNGGSELIEMIMRGFLNPGDQCIYSTPGFIPHWEFAHKFGVETINVPLAKEDFQINVSSILDAITDRTKLVILASPNNPTGTIIPQSLLDTYFSQVPQHVVTLLDEVYCHYVEDPRYCTAMPYVLTGKHVIGLNSFSKAFGLAGLRIGFAYSSSDIATYLRGIKRPFAINSVSLAAAHLALQDPEYLEKIRIRTSQTKMHLYGKFDEWGLTYWRSEANFILLQVPDSALCYENLYVDNLLVRPVDTFGASNCIRISVGTDEAMSQLLDCIEKKLALFVL